MFYSKIKYLGLGGITEEYLTTIRFGVQTSFIASIFAVDTDVKMSTCAEGVLGTVLDLVLIPLAGPNTKMTKLVKMDTLIVFMYH